MGNRTVTGNSPGTVPLRAGQRVADVERGGGPRSAGHSLVPPPVGRASTHRCDHRRRRSGASRGHATVPGLAVGGEWTGAALLTAENSPAAKRGHYGMYPQFGPVTALLRA